MRNERAGMRLRFAVVFMFIGISMFAPNLLNALVQEASQEVTARTTSCSEINKTFPLTLPNESKNEGSIGPTQKRAELQFDGSTLLTVRELRSPTDAGAYNSTLSVKDSSGDREFSLPNLIKGGEGLRLFRASLICDQSKQPLLILGFVAGWTDAVQGFVVVRYSARKLQVEGLPIASHGKLVVSRRSPGTMKLWSALDQGLCEACRKRYIVRDCQLNEKGLACRRRVKPTAPKSPNAITAHIIEIK